MKYIPVLSVVFSLALFSTAHAAGDINAGKAKASACMSCHGSNGISKQEQYPNLAGQKRTYLAKQLSAFRDGSRQDPVMNAIVKGLSDEDINNLSAWFASLK